MPRKVVVRSRALVTQFLVLLVASSVGNAQSEIDWPAWGAAPGGSHFSEAQQITPENVSSLKLAWSHRSGDFREEEGGRGESDWRPQSSLQVTPIMVDEVLYYCTPTNRVFALDAATGEEKWVFDPQLPETQEVLPNCRGVSSWSSGKDGVCESRILTGTLDARLIALDAHTGEPCADFGDGGSVDTAHRITPHEPVEYGITSPPAILGDLVITGAMVLDNRRTDAPAGVVRAYDIRSGELRWAWNPVPPGQEPLNDEGNYVGGTTNVWSIISVDPERKLVFVPTGNSNPDFYGGHRDDLGGEPLDYYSSSVVALDVNTGEVRWNYQTVHHDIWDYDAPAQPTLVDLEVDGERVPAVVQVTKMGMTFALHRETGEPLWPVEERAVPQGGAVPGEYLSPTQPFPTHIPHLIPEKLEPDDAWGLTFWDRGACRDALEALRNEGLYTPPSIEGSIHYSGSSGGNNWGSPAIDPRSGIMVVYTTRMPWHITLKPQEECEGFFGAQAGTPYCVRTTFVNSPIGMPCTKPPWGTLDAIDLNAGKLLWSVPLGTSRDLAPFPFWYIKGLPGGGAPILTASGLVFSGVANEYAFRAFDAKTGDELWKVRLPTSAHAMPMTYMIDGKQYVVVAAGGHWSGGSPPSDHIMAYALPDQ